MRESIGLGLAAAVGLAGCAAPPNGLEPLPSPSFSTAPAIDPTFAPPHLSPPELLGETTVAAHGIRGRFMLARNIGAATTQIDLLTLTGNGELAPGATFAILCAYDNPAESNPMGLHILPVTQENPRQYGPSVLVYTTPQTEANRAKGAYAPWLRECVYPAANIPPIYPRP